MVSAPSRMPRRAWRGGTMSSWSRAANCSSSSTPGTSSTITDRSVIGDPALANGNGVLIWFEVEDFDAAAIRAAELRAEIVLPRHRNPPDGDGGPNHWEIWVKDPDGYTVVLASPYGTADGDWKPSAAGW